MRKFKHHPIQDFEIGEDSVLRFKPNKIVCFLVEHCAPTNLQAMSLMASEEDRAQLAMLLGYSFCGYLERDFKFKRKEIEALEEKFRTACKVHKQSLAETKE